MPEPIRVDAPVTDDREYRYAAGVPVEKFAWRRGDDGESGCSHMTELLGLWIDRVGIENVVSTLMNALYFRRTGLERDVVFNSRGDDQHLQHCLDDWYIHRFCEDALDKASDEINAFLKSQEARKVGRMCFSKTKLMSLRKTLAEHSASDKEAT